MNEKKLLSWWQSRFPTWAAVTAPLVRLHLNSTVHTPCVATTLRIAFLISEIPKLPLTSHKIASRLAGLSRAATPQVIQDLQTIGVQPLADFLIQYPDYERRFDPYAASGGQEFVVQSYDDLVNQLAAFAKANRNEIKSEVSRIEESPAPTFTKKIRAADQVELCFCHADSLAAADDLEQILVKIEEHHQSFGSLDGPSQLKCDEISKGYKQIVKEDGLEKRPAVLDAWLERARVSLEKFSQQNFHRPSQAGKEAINESNSELAKVLSPDAFDFCKSLGPFSLKQDSDSLLLCYENLTDLANDWTPTSLVLKWNKRPVGQVLDETNKDRIQDAIQVLSGKLYEIRKMALSDARENYLENLASVDPTYSKKMSDAELGATVRSLKLEIEPTHSMEEILATLEFDCDWDLEHGYGFRIRSDGEVVVGLYSS
jgi:hypothetical protein